jgi:hypothetical protein
MNRDRLYRLIRLAHLRQDRLALATLQTVLNGTERYRDQADYAIRVPLRVTGIESELRAMWGDR